MANKSYYLEALVDLNRPATVRDIHDHALKLFGRDAIRGDRTSCRLSLMRHIGGGRVVKRNNLFEATEMALDPASYMTARIRVLEAELEKAQNEVRRLRYNLENRS